MANILGRAGKNLKVDSKEFARTAKQYVKRQAKAKKPVSKTVEKYVKAKSKNKASNKLTVKDVAKIAKQVKKSTATAEEIRDKYLELTGGQTARRVELSALRDRFPNVPHAVMTKQLLAMEKSGKAVLYSKDTGSLMRGKGVHERDMAAGVPNSVGNIRDIIYIQD